eukprot:CAMPEP_0174977404 /NCGR_PEP_ID=MMETSP0004_2-20121128/13585_1 /TAXON_ID=420556 /ORGANISM="Ochromonas sp., Strain CCMP1393" /LENGTH=274 /DNA_ID=CAMNT_0016228573 /DNA_START=17 /DNA_END=841 /DNA_ORIENTATION=-
MPVFHSEDEESESDSEDESCSSEEASGDEGRIMKPVFVRKEQRLTIQEQEKKQLEEEAAQQKKKFMEEERKVQTREKVAESIRKMDEVDELYVNDADSDAGLPDDTDNADDELEFEAWRVREMARLTRDMEEREEAIVEKAELLRRRNLTDAERDEEDRKSGRLDNHKPDKSNWSFMQKYYHKGAFYMDSTSVRSDADVRAKNYAAEPTLGDRVDMEKLPQVMQVKNFGKRGRTKYTHLLDQDTTVHDKKRVDTKPDRSLMDKYLDKRSGMGKL